MNGAIDLLQNRADIVNTSAERVTDIGPRGHPTANWRAPKEIAKLLGLFHVA